MAPDDFAAEMDRLWLQVKPLYDALHAFTRNGLERAYGARGAAPDGRIPAHLLGNMWSRDGLEAGHLTSSAIRCAATAFNTSTSASVCADPRCSMSRDPCRDFHTTWTATAPDEVRTVRTYATGTPSTTRR